MFINNVHLRIMKKTIILICLLLAINSSSSAQQTLSRNYRNSEYVTATARGNEKKFSTITINWDKNNASTLDNIRYIVYPDGYVVPYTIPTYFAKTNNEDDIFRFYATDEGNREVECFITKFSESKIGIMLYYNENLHYYFYVDLLKFLY